MTTHKLWNDVKNYNDLAHFETALGAPGRFVVVLRATCEPRYVVKFHQAFYPTSQIEPLDFGENGN